MCLIKIINHYPAKSALYKFYKKHNEIMFEDLYEPFWNVVKETDLEEDFDIWWDSATVQDILQMFDFSGLVTINLTEDDIKNIQADYIEIEADLEDLAIADYLKEVFARGWFEIKIEPHKFFKYFTKMKTRA